MTFPFVTTPSAVCEPGATSRLGPLIGARNGSVVRLVADPGMVRAIEACTSASVDNDPISRALAREALRLLGAHVRTAVTDGDDVRTRSAT